MSTPTAEELLDEITRTLPYGGTGAMICRQLAQRLATALAEVERLKQSHHAAWVDDWEKLRQRAEAAEERLAENEALTDGPVISVIHHTEIVRRLEAEVERLRELVHNSVALKTHEQLRQRAEEKAMTKFDEAGNIKRSTSDKRPLLERLRTCFYDEAQEAANEIERLRTELRQRAEAAERNVIAAEAEMHRLRALLAEVRASLERVADECAMGRSTTAFHLAREALEAKP